AAELHLRLQLLVLMAKAGAGQGSLRQLSLWHHRKNTAVVGGLPAHTDAARQLRARTQPHTAGDVDAVPVLNLIRADLAVQFGQVVDLSSLVRVHVVEPGDGVAAASRQPRIDGSRDAELRVVA